MYKKLIKYFDSNDIDYRVINGYYTLDDDQLKGDIDILIKKNKFLCLENYINDFCIRNNFRIIQVLSHHIYSKNIFIANMDNDILNIDIYCNLYRKKWIFVNEDDIFKRENYHNEIKILAPEYEFVYYLSKKIDKNELNEEVYTYLKELYRNNINSIKKIINNTYKKENMIIQIFESNYLDYQISKKNYFKNISLNSYITIDYFFKKITWYVRRIKNRTGYFLVIMGPDGSGKSTIINKIILARLPFRQIKYYHLKPFGMDRVDNTENSTNPIPTKTYGKVISYIKIFYYIVIFWWGYIKNIYPLLIRSNLVIFDRYIYDLCIDPIRFGYSGSIKIAEYFIYKLMPRPDTIIILDAETAEILERKPERTFEELEILRTRYSQLHALMPSSAIINTAINENESYKNLISIFYKKLSLLSQNKF